MAPPLALQNNLTYEETSLNVPPLEDILNALRHGLPKYFAEVDVNIVECPDLTLPPYNLAGRGLGGGEFVSQIGDVSYVLPNTRRDKIYDFKNVAKAINSNPAFIIGAGGGNWCRRNTFSEMFMNILVSEKSVRNLSKELFSKDETLNGVVAEASDVDNSIFSCLGNIFVSRGEPGPVIQIVCKRRTKENNLPESIIAAIKEKFSQPIAFGMVFQMIRGKAIHHVARTFAQNVNNAAASEQFLLIPEIEAPFISLGTILTSNLPDCNVAPFHFHSYNNNFFGGHYRWDITPEEAEYVAFLKPGKKFCLIDRAARQLILSDFDERVMQRN
ncbi:hypothetical protein V9T40_008097 [Parthenolecanium corni]|uniref:DUF1907 domain-containing protein n=1 Tax=Parthenolecanium corni TaxID=536013 RepID=A0AAN9Y761_9HEMI